MCVSFFQGVKSMVFANLGLIREVCPHLRGVLFSEGKIYGSLLTWELAGVSSFERCP